ncbi:MAG: PadR family transcriptional regulator [Caulobacteraceae bacterium]
MGIAITELENCTLATIRRDQPCSAYEVRQVFARSSTPNWSGSTGAIYPVIKRLLGRGLIRVEPQAGDRRARQNLTVTDEGEQAVRAWVTTIEPWASHATPDPIRTRVSYLGQLASNAQRIAFVKHAYAATERTLKDLRHEVDALKAGPSPEFLAGLGALRQLEARLVWLREAASLYEAAEDSNGAAS